MSEETVQSNSVSEEKKINRQKNALKWIADLSTSILAGFIVALGLHMFANSPTTKFVPGGITGIAKILNLVTGDKISMGYFMLMLNIPIFVLEAIFVDKKLGLVLTVYALTQSFSLVLFENINLWQYQVEDWERVYAAIATGVVTGIGFSIQIRRHGASGGTFAISSLIKRWNPGANIAWLSFAMDVGVIFLTFFVFSDSTVSSVICTFINLFIADIVVDRCVRGTKDGYKFEIITDDPEEISTRIITELKHGVTELTVNGMYSRKEKYMIICIIRKRELSKMLKILKAYPKTFANFSSVNEVLGRFKK